MGGGKSMPSDRPSRISERFVIQSGWLWLVLRAIGVFSETALKFRDPSLCANVRQRRSLFSSSWGYSKANCDQLVVENIAADRKLLEEKRNGYLNRAIQLRDFRIERNGNGRDFDIIPTFTGEAANSYNLRFDILLSLPAGETVLLHCYFCPNNNRMHLRIYVR
jgi:hypothetical protein